MQFDGTWYNYYYYKEAQPLSIDTEGTTAEENVFHGSKTLLIKEDGLLQLIMFKDRSPYMISGTATPDIAYKLLNSVN